MSTTVTKEVEFAGTLFKVCGPATDSYFSDLHNHMAGNKFFRKVLTSYVRPGSTVIDVGANIGVTTMLTSKLVPQSRIVAIEPSPIAFNCLRSTVEANGLRGVTVLQLCVSDGRLPSVHLLETTGNLSGSHIIASDHPTTTVEGGRSVIAKALDSVVDELALDRVDLVKIDVEGYELDVLNGMSRTIAKFAPLIFMEFNSWTLVAFRNISPRILLDQVRKRFGEVHYLAADGSITCARTDDDFLGLLHTNMVQHGCVDDIMFSSDPKRLTIGEMQNAHQDTGWRDALKRVTGRWRNLNGRP
jgi:FkbM family methyltransferase